MSAGTVLSKAVLLLCFTCVWSQEAPHRSPSSSQLFEETLSRHWSDAQRAIAQKRFGAAEEHASKGAEFARYTNNASWEAAFLRAVGETYERRGSIEQALGYYEQSLAIRRRERQDHEAARLGHGIGFLLHKLERYREARPYAESAVETFSRSGSFESVPAATADAYAQSSNRRKLAFATLLLGQVQLGLADLAAAEQSTARARAIFVEMNVVGSTAICDSVLGEIAWRRSRYREALEKSFRALDENRAVKNQTETARNLEILGHVFFEMSDFEKALSYYRSALDLRSTVRDKAGLAFSYSNAGAALTELRRYEEALGYQEQALTVRRELNRPRDVAATLINVGFLYDQLGRPAAADAALTEALQLSEDGGFLRHKATALSSMGQTAVASGDLRRGEDLYRRALDAYRTLEDESGISFTLTQIGSIKEKVGELKRATALYADAATLFEHLRDSLADPLHVATFRSRADFLYAHYMRVLVLQNRAADAFAVSERARAAALGRWTTLNSADFASLLSEPELEQFRAAETALAGCSNRVESLDPTSVRQAEAARAEYFEAERNLDAVRDRIFAANERVASRHARQFSADALTESFARMWPRSLFLQWTMLDGDSAILFTLAGSRGNVTADILDVGAVEFARLENCWHQSAGRPGVRGVRVPSDSTCAGLADEPAVARKLYDAMLRPKASLVESGRWERLVVSSDGPLLAIPFYALIDSTGHRLIDRLPVTSAVSLFHFTRNTPPKRPGIVLAIGDPLESGEVRRVPPDSTELMPLENARREVRGIAALDPSAVVLIGHEASEREVKRRMREASVLHFATHGILDNAAPLRSSLLLARESEVSTEDGLLHAREIAHESLNARLVVLSACETARGVLRPGEGLMSLAWAFQAAGVPNTVASLWNVDDRGTSELMIHFYKELRRGVKVDAALRNAARYLRSKPGYGAPFYWAAFLSFGPPT